MTAPARSACGSRTTGNRHETHGTRCFLVPCVYGYIVRSALCSGLRDPFLLQLRPEQDTERQAEIRVFEVAAEQLRDVGEAVQRLDRVDEDIAFQRLRVGGELDLRAVAAGRAPAVRREIADHAQQIPVGILIFERHARERQDAVRVRDVEQIAVLPISEPPVIENSDVPTSASPDMDW